MSHVATSSPRQPPQNEASQQVVVPIPAISLPVPSDPTLLSVSQTPSNASCVALCAPNSASAAVGVGDIADAGGAKGGKRVKTDGNYNRNDLSAGVANAGLNDVAVNVLKKQNVQKLSSPSPVNDASPPEAPADASYHTAKRDVDAEQKETHDHKPDDNHNHNDDDDDDDDPFAGLDDVASMDLYDISNYTFGKKNTVTKSKAMLDVTNPQLVKSLSRRYNERGMRRSVGAVILVHSHNFPHVLLLQRHDGKGPYSFPGGRLRPGESDEEGLQRKLMSKLTPGEGNDVDQEQPSLDVGEKSTIFFSFSSSFLLKPPLLAFPSFSFPFWFSPHIHL